MEKIHLFWVASRPNLLIAGVGAASQNDRGRTVFFLKMSLLRLDIAVVGAAVPVTATLNVLYREWHMQWHPIASNCETHTQTTPIGECPRARIFTL